MEQIFKLVYFTEISIHSPIAEADLTGVKGTYTMQISIHSPIAEADLHLHSGASHYGRFQSTAPSQRLTFYPPLYYCLPFISIHSPIAEADSITILSASVRVEFQSTAPSQRLTMEEMPKLPGTARFQSTAPSQRLT